MRSARRRALEIKPGKTPVQRTTPATYRLTHTGQHHDVAPASCATAVAQHDQAPAELRRLSLGTVLVGIVLGFGAAMLPLGLGAPTAVALPAFALAGAIWTPYTATSMALLQNSTTDDQRTSVLAANSAVLVVSVPLGTALGGPAVQLVGAEHPC